jgi:hypothetical protein
MPDRVITGGQTGADQAAWWAAKAAGIPTGGAMPSGFLTEAGPRPNFAELFGAHALKSANIPAQIAANVEASDGTLWFGCPDSPDGEATVRACGRLGRPVLVIRLGWPPALPSDVVEWLHENRVKVLNVAGNRESLEPGVGQRVEAFLRGVFRLAKGRGDGV